jgi:hypothetical protein
MPRPKELQDSVNLGFRVPGALIEKLDRYCERVRAQHGHHVSRSDAIRVLLEKALTAEGLGDQPAARKRK